MLITIPPSISTSPSPPKRKRGGQPANQNARRSGAYSSLKPGPISAARLLFKNLLNRLEDPSFPLDQAIEQAQAARVQLLSISKAGNDDFVPAAQLGSKFSNQIGRFYSSCTHARRLSVALSSITHYPFGWFELAYKDCGISRDADSFHVVSDKSAQYSPIPPCHPDFATNLTDSQWAVIAPLIPPDPHLDHLTGTPPLIIAANRWGFTRYHYTGEFQDFVIMEHYYEVLQRFPGLSGSHLPSGEGLGVRGRGRPRTSPRILLDAIIWKLATGHAWDDLPLGFPPVRLCQKYYRRLFLSGRWYTLLLALYNHMRLEVSQDLLSLLEAGVFTTTPAQKIALSPQAPPSWENYTALLFMQLARSAYTRLQRSHKESHPFYTLLPDFQGIAPLSTGLSPGLASPCLLSNPGLPRNLPLPFCLWMKGLPGRNGRRSKTIAG